MNIDIIHGVFYHAAKVTIPQLCFASCETCRKSDIILLNGKCLESKQHLFARVLKTIQRTFQFLEVISSKIVKK